jgi:hypothetical protein
MAALSSPPRSARIGTKAGLDHEVRQRVGRREAEHAAIERKLGAEHRPGGVSPAKAVLLAFEDEVGDRQALAAQSLDHELRQQTLSHRKATRIRRPPGFEGDQCA